MFLPARYGMNPMQRSACLAGQCQGSKCFWVGDAPRMILPPRQIVFHPILTSVKPVPAPVVTPVATAAIANVGAPAASMPAAAGTSPAASAGASPSLLQNALAWVQANPLLTGGLVLGALLLMKGGRR